MDRDLEQSAQTSRQSRIPHTGTSLRITPQPNSSITTQQLQFFGRASPGQALSLFETAIDSLNRGGHVAWVTRALADLAVFFDRNEQPEIAATLYGTSTHHSSRTPPRRLRAIEDHLRETLGDTAFNEHHATGAALELADAVRYARDQIHLARRRAQQPT